MARHIDDLIELTEQIFSQISSHPAFSWKLRARSKLSPSDHTISVSCCFWYAVSVWILDSSRSDPGSEYGGRIFINLYRNEAESFNLHWFTNEYANYQRCDDSEVTRKWGERGKRDNNWVAWGLVDVCLFRNWGMRWPTNRSCATQKNVSHTCVIYSRDATTSYINWIF